MVWSYSDTICRMRSGTSAAVFGGAQIALLAATILGSIPELGAARQRFQSQAQQGRRSVAGSVTDCAGQPWAGATVTLIARAIPDYPHAGRADEIRVVADADGKFRVRVLTFRRYSAWAHERLKGGSHRLSDVVQDVCHGLPIALIPLLAVVEFIGLFIKPFALTVRLFANMLAGHMILYSFIGMIFLFAKMLKMEVFASSATAIPSAAMGVFISIIESFISLLQAYIFVFLSVIFVHQSMHPAH